jgi:KipI family sensor histidine kinase inhibitor
MRPVTRPRYLSAGDAGLVVELGSEIDAAVNDRVVALAAALEAMGLPGIRECVPTYRSLLVQYDPVTLPRTDLIAAVEGCWPPTPLAGSARTHWRVPVLYGGEAGEDLPAVAALHGLSEEEVVRLHSGASYRVYMLGFAPGFAYLGGLPERIHTSRRADPRAQTPPGSISIGGQQAAISPPLPIPSGWHLLGRTPVRSYDPARSAMPFLFAPGDIVRFEPVSALDYATLRAAAEAGDLVAVREPSDG